MSNINLSASELQAFKAKISEWADVEEGGRNRLDRQIYLDPVLFELELKYIFERNWVFVAHESQIPNPNDYVTTWMGRQPVLVTRDRSGLIRCLVNACSHRGALVCRNKAGNRRSHTCRFHGWVYANDGTLLSVTTEARGGYAETFNRSDLGLPSIHVESYRGFIFASLNPDVPALGDYLGEAKALLDLVLNQTPGGQWEVVRGTTMYSYPGNWKLAPENGLDGYHVGTVHASYVQATMQRLKGTSGLDTKALDLSGIDRYRGGFQAFENGHGMIWSEYPNQKDRPTYKNRDFIVKTYGEAFADWTLTRIRNLFLAPNVFVMDSACTQIRIVRPVAVDHTEVTTYCFAPAGEDAESRAKRIRQYEDFYNASGLATPDDLSEFGYCQVGYGARESRWSDISRGSATFVRGSGAMGSDLGFDAMLSAENEPGNEGMFVGMYRDWRTRMLSALDQELAVRQGEHA